MDKKFIKKYYDRKDIERYNKLSDKNKLNQYINIAEEKRIDRYSIEKDLEKIKDSIQAKNDYIAIIEDKSPRRISYRYGNKRVPGKIVLCKQKYFQFKGLVVSVGEKIKSVKSGDWVVWGLYGGERVQIKDVSVWFVKPEKILVKTDKDSILND